MGDIITVLTIPPGSLGYHLALSVSLGLLLWLTALYHARRVSGSPSTWALAAPGLLSVRLVLFTVDGLTWFGSIEGSVLLAPLDRFTSLFGVAIFAWAAYAPSLQRKSDLALGAITVLGLLGVVATILTLRAGPAAAGFNGSLADRIWSTVGLGLAAAALIVLTVRRRAGWQLAGSALFLLGLGFAWHLFAPPDGGSLAGSVRTAELLAYPLLGLAGAQVLSRMQAGGQAVSSQPSAAQIPEPALRDSPQSAIYLERSIRESQDRIKFLEQEIVRLGRIAGTISLPRQGEPSASPGPAAAQPPRPRGTRLRKPDGTWLDLAQWDQEGLANLDGSEVSIEELQVVLDELAETRAQIVDLEHGLEGSPVEAGPHAPGIGAVSDFTHELSLQASSTKDHIDLLLNDRVGLLGGLQRKFLERVRNNIDRMSSLIEDLNNIAQSAAKARPLDAAPVELGACLEEAYRSVEDGLERKKISLDRHTPQILQPVLGERETVVELLSLLLNHAIEVSPRGSSVEVSAESQDTEVGSFLILSVTDSSKGLQPEELASVFQQIHGGGSIDDGVPSAYADTLATVKTLSDALGWRLWVDSEMGVGSTFTVLMPLFAQPAGI